MSDSTELRPLRSESRRRPALADLACAVGLAAGFVASYVWAALTPTLLRHHVVLLEALAGSIVSIVTGGAFARVGRVPLPLVVAAPLCGIVLYDVFMWWAGRRWGPRLAGVYARGRPRAGRAIERAETLVRRRGFWALAAAYYLPIPNVLVYLACGSSEMPVWIFLLGDAVGTLLWTGMLAGLGWAVGREAVDTVTAIDHHATLVTVGICAVWLVGWSILRRRARRRSGTRD